MGAGKGVQRRRLSQGRAPAETQEEGDTKPLQHIAITGGMVCKRHSKIRKELMLRKKSHSAQGLRFQTLQAVQKQDRMLARNRPT